MKRAIEISVAILVFAVVLGCVSSVIFLSRGVAFIAILVLLAFSGTVWFWGPDYVLRTRYGTELPSLRAKTR